MRVATKSFRVAVELEETTIEVDHPDRHEGLPPDIGSNSALGAAGAYDALAYDPDVDALPPPSQQASEPVDEEPRPMLVGRLNLDLARKLMRPADQRNTRQRTLPAGFCTRATHKKAHQEEQQNTLASTSRKMLPG